MTDGVFKPVSWTVNELVQAVSSGTLALPDLQRPFVWDNPKVRDLIDSMYRGYPVGELMFWHRGSGEDVTTIGTDGKSQAVTHQIVDGQQRLTSLYAVFTGRDVVDDRYRTKNIRISFNPFIERFEVAKAITDGSADWVPNIHTVFNAPLEAYEDFRARYEEKHPDELDDVAKKRLFSTFNKLSQLGGYQFTVVELQQAVDKPKVADIFVRINSEGVSLKSADFILTWLSVFWPEGREEMENFSRGSRITAERASELAGHKVSWTPINHHLHVNPGQLVRVAVAVGQNRGRLQDAYGALQGRDHRTGLSDPARQEAELDKLKSAVPLMLDHLNWDEFLRVMTKAGFRSRKMITSNNTVIYTYALWLIGRERFSVEQSRLRDLMSRWFFMSQTTGRYTNSPETKIQQDLDRLDGVADADGFVAALEGVIATVLTGDYWTIRMPDDLVSSSLASSPVYQGYLAALNVLDADLFMLHGKIRDWMDPTATTVKDVEGHHLFPKNYLNKSLGLSPQRRLGP